MPYDFDESLDLEKEETLTIVCPWELPGSDVPLTRAQMAIFTPDLLDPEEASAS